MFYLDQNEPILRFGDVIEGYIIASSNITNPLNSLIHQYFINVNVPQFCVVIDPDCHIGKGTLSITPLEKITASYFDNPRLFKDLTKVNSPAMPLEAIHPEQWNKLPLATKREYINVEPDYTYRDVFIYGENEKLPPYPISRSLYYEEVIDASNGLPKFIVHKKSRTFQTGYFMINFKYIFHLSCKDIVDQNRDLDVKIQTSKTLQLTDNTRNNLRKKLGSYFAGIP